MNWISFLDEHHIEYVERGPNTARGNISIACPYCGVGDPSHHLGISLQTGFWGCLRDENHRGRIPTRLIQALLKCSRLQAELLAKSADHPSLDQFDSIIQSLSLELVETEHKIDKVRFPPNIKNLVDRGLGRKFIDYLVSRDYTREEARHLCEVYWLMYAVEGPFAYRVIVPIEMEDGLVTWTGRDITGTAEARYKTLSKLESKQSIKECLFGYKSLIEDHESHTLIVCEGPFDCMRVDFFGYQFGIRATCLFGLQSSTEQVRLLSKLSQQFKHKYISLDAGAIVQQMHQLDKLSFLNFADLKIPDDNKDPGSLSKQQLRRWFQTIC